MLSKQVPDAGSLMVLNCGSLRCSAEWFVIKRHLTREEWSDVRESWCKLHRAVLCVQSRDDPDAIKRAAEKGIREGYHYILLEVL